MAEQQVGQKRLPDPISPQIVYYLEGACLVQENLKTGAKVKSRPVSMDSPLKAEEVLAQSAQRSLKFVSGLSEHVEVSPCGLILLSRSDKITQVSLNKCFSSGVHCWEFYCPLSCYGITIGLRQVGGRREQTFDFSSSTPRTITLKLDLNRKVWMCWINLTVPVRKPVRQLNDSDWQPFIRIKEKGNMVLLNPFAADPERQVSQFNMLPSHAKLEGVEPYSELTLQKDERDSASEASFTLTMVNEDTLAIIQDYRMVKLLYRNQRSQKFEADNSPRVFQQEGCTLVELAFTQQEIGLLGSFSKLHNVKWLSVAKSSSQGYLVTLAVDKWAEIFSHMLSLCDTSLAQLSLAKLGTLPKDALPAQLLSEQWLYEVYRTIGEKLEQLKPLSKNFEGCPISEFDRLSRWGTTQLFFRDDHPEQRVSIPKSLFQNSFPPLVANSIRQITATQHYLILESVSKEKGVSLLELFNYELVPFKVMDIDLARGFSKAAEVAKYKEIIDSMKKSNEIQPSIYKILSECLVEAKKIKPQAPKPALTQPKEQKPKQPAPAEPQKKGKSTKEPTKAKEKAGLSADPKLLQSFVQMGFPIDKCRKALIETKNVSLEVALDYLMTMTEEDSKKETGSTGFWCCSVCTLQNPSSVTECDACATPMTPTQVLSTPEVPAEEVPDVKPKCEQAPAEQPRQQRISRNIEEELLCYAIVQTNIGTAPVLVVGCFESTMRIRLLGQNPMYYSKFHLKNEKGFIDYCDLSFHDSVETIEQRPVRYLDHVFVGAEGNKQVAFGWIVLEDEDVKLDQKTTKVAIKNTAAGHFSIELVGKEKTREFSVEVRKEWIYNELNKALSSRQVGPSILPAVKEIPKQRSIISYSKDISAPSHSSLTLECVFSQAGEKESLTCTGSLDQTISKPQPSSAESCSGYIPLIIEEAPPGCNMHYPVCSILYPSRNTFLANYPYRIVLSHLHGKHMQVDSVVIEKMGSNKNTKLIKAGYVYLLNYSHKQPATKHYFQIGPDSRKVQVSVNDPRPYRYLVVEPIYQDDCEVEQAPFEIGLVGALGQGVEPPQSDLEEAAAKQAQINILRKQLKLELYGYKGVERQSLVEYEIEEFILNDRSELQQLSLKELQERVQQHQRLNVPVDVCVKIRPKHASAYGRVQLESIEVGPSWKLVSSRFLADCDSVRGVRCTDTSASTDAGQLVTDFMKGAPGKAEELLRLSQANSSVCSVLLSKVALRDYIEQRLLKCSKIEYEPQAALLEEFLKQAEFLQAVDIGSYLQADRLLELPYTAEGLQLLFKIVHRASVADKQISTLLDWLLERISRHRQPEYRLLRKSNNYSLGLETQLFSDYYCRLVQSQQPDSASLFQASHYMSKFVLIKNRFSRQYIIDLTNRVHVRNILLSFDRSDSKAKMIMRAYRIDQSTAQPEKKLICQHYYQDSVWVQLTRNAYSQEMNRLFKNPIQSGLNCLALSGLDFHARYLVIEMAFTIIPNTGDQRELDNLPINEVVPEVFGEYSGELDPLFQEYFNVKPGELSFFNTLKYHQISRIAKYSFVRDGLEYLYYDNQDNMPQKEEGKKKSSPSLTLSTAAARDLLEKGHSKECLDFDYTLMSMLLPVLSTKLLPASSIPEATCLRLFELLVKGEKGPITDRAVAFLRKLIRSDDQLYAQLLRQSHTLDSFAVFREMAVMEDVVRAELLKGPSKDLVRSVIGVARLNTIRTSELVELVISEAIRHGLEEMTVPLLKLYKMPFSVTNRILKGLCSKQPQEAIALIRSMRGNSELLQLAKECFEEDFKTFDMIVEELTSGAVDPKNEPFIAAYKSLADHILKLLAKQDRQRDLKALIKLAKTFGLSPPSSQAFIELFVKSKHRARLEAQFLQMKLLKTPENSAVLLRYILRTVDDIVGGRSSLKKEGWVIDLLAFLVENTSKEFEPSACLYSTPSVQLADAVLRSLATLLNRCLMMVGIDNVKLAPLEIHRLVELANYLACISCCSLTEYAGRVQQYHIGSLIGWYLINNVPSNKALCNKSYLLNRFGRLSLNVREIIGQAAGQGGSNISMARYVLATCLQKLQEVDRLVPTLTELLFSRALADTVCKGFKTITHELLKNSQLLSYFCCELGGFAWMIDNLCSYQHSAASQPLKQAEQASNLTIVGDAVTPKDWLVNKAGNKSASIYNVTYSSDPSKDSELLLHSSNGILLTKLALGLVVTDNTEKNNVLPREIELYGGQEKDECEFIGSLEPIPDDHYLNFSTKVYGLNLGLLREQVDSYAALFEQLSQNRSLRYIRLVFKRPQVLSLADMLDVPQKSTKNLWSSISFLSAMGHNSSEAAPPTDISATLKLLQVLSSRDNKGVIMDILSRNQLKDKLESSLNRVCEVTTQAGEERLFHSFIEVVSEHSAELGDCIIDRYLTDHNAIVHAQIISQIVLSNYSLVDSRLQKLHEFVLKALRGRTGHQVVPFVKKEVEVLHILSLDSANKHSGKHIAHVMLKTDIQDLICMVELATTSWSNFKEDLIKLAVTLVLSSSPFSTVEPGALEQLLSYLWKPSTRLLCVDILAALLIGSERAVQWFNDQKGLPAVFETIETIIGQQNGQVELTNYLMFLSDLCHTESLKRAISSSGFSLSVFKRLSTLQNRIGGASNKDLRAALVDFLVNSTVGTESEKALAGLLKESLDTLGTQTGSDYLMETEVFLPILNSFSSVPVCLQSYNEVTKHFISNPNEVLLKENSEVAEEFKPSTTAGSAAGAGKADTLKPVSQFLTKEMQKELTGLCPKEVDIQLAYTQTQDALVPAFQTVKSRLLGNSFLLMVQTKQENGPNVILGAYYQHEEGYPKLQDNAVLWLKWNPGCFLFCFEESGKLAHFKNPKSSEPFIQFDSTPFETLEMGWTEEGGQVNVLLDSEQRINLSFRSGGESTFDFSQCTDSQEKIKAGPVSSKFVKAEYWLVKPAEAPKKQPTKPAATTDSRFTRELIGTMPSIQLFGAKYQRDRSAFCMLRSHPVYLLPGELKISEVKNFLSVIGTTLSKGSTEALEFFTEGMSHRCSSDTTLEEIAKKQSPYKPNSIVDLQYNAEQLFNDSTLKDLTSREQSRKQQATPVEFLPKKGLFKAFEAAQGVTKLIDIVSERISLWKHQDRAKKWMQYIQEVKSFSSFPYFFSTYMKEKEAVDLLLNLLVGLPDREELKKWQDMENKSIRQLYKIVADVLLLDRSLEFRQYSIDNKFITTILDRLQLLSKEEKRRFVKDFQEKEEEGSAQAIKGQDDDGSKKIKKKKGVGYGTESSGNSKWTTGQNSEMKKETSEQIRNILTMLANFLDSKEWKVPKSVVEEILCSCLLPLIEAMLRAGTLLEISKQPQGFKCVLRTIEMLAKHRGLVPCLMEIPKTYQPSQVESVYSLLKALDNTSRIFISCIGQNSSASSESNKVSEEIASEVIKTFKVVEQAIEEYRDTDENDTAFKNILELPLDKKYRELLKDLRFDYVSMRDSTGKMKHHYCTYGSPNHVNSVTKTVRLAQELADLSTSLPIEHTNSIFVRCDKQRVDFMQALIMGANGTPYGHGAYLFDIYFDDTYPNSPPKVNLMTTGSGKVRFNPNLYSCGKVCLSLLGTWRGNAAENWDPKISTLLQVLVSIQAIIMSEDVYFNEPGFENEQGTDEGQKKNEAYSNIVRYSNVKFAMTENIKHPPAGFETVVRRHFYLKKDEILQETEKWLKYAAKRDANYVGLVNDHNHSWSTEFKKNKGRYLEMLTTAVNELRDELNKIPAPSISDMSSKKSSPKKKKEAPKQAKNQQEGAADLTEVDVSYSTEGVVQKELTIDDEKVRDRWSRYIGAMGIDAVSKQAKASVLVVGLGPFSLEVTKNIVLSGCRRLTIHDTKEVSLADLSGGFFYSEGDIGKKRVTSILHKIQELNQYVKVDLLAELDPSKLEGYDVVFVTETPLSVQVELDEYCRKKGIKFVSADCVGPYSRLFNDFGEKFEVLDKNGEEAVEVMIKSISTAEKAVVTLLDGAKHPFEDGEVIIIKGVDGMEILDPNLPVEQGQEQLKSINGTLHKIETINSNSFRIGSTLGFKPYVRNGTAKNLKLPVSMQFPSLKAALELPASKLPLDDNLATYDFVKMETTGTVSGCFRALDQFTEKESRRPKPWCYEDSNLFMKYYRKYAQEDPKQKQERFVRTFSMVSQGNLPPLCAFWGGFVSQEIIKAITQKFKPTKSLFFCEFSELVEDLPEDFKEWPNTTGQIQKKLLEKPNRAQGFSLIVGEKVQTMIESCKLFMIGAGAIGCQLLKNFAMINLSTGEKGSILVTDPDHIQTSNLNRQFLFREKHLRKPKSSTAAASVIQMNPLLKGHVIARLDKVHEGTKDTFSNKFFQSLTIVANALDNVQARRYVDQRCVENKIPLLESGTLGPKGHVQVIVPKLTESYGSKNDPVEEGQIPHCTLKMFPEETLHCIEWARDKFGHKFSLKPKALLKITEEKYKPDQSEVKTLSECLKLLRKRPSNFGDCITIGIKKFYKYFRDDVLQLLYTYPLDAKTKNGEPFWKLPKRPPTALEMFDPENSLQCTFVASYAVMLAKIFGVPYPKNFRTDKERFEIGRVATKIKIEPFTPSDKKAKSIMSESEKKKEDEEEKEEEVKATEDEQQLFDKIKTLYTKDLQMSSQEFEKDDDANGHIDFIYSMANLRALNYRLEPMDWITTKIKAGRIVPALSTTTTAIAGLQTLELCKYIKGAKLDKLRNSFLNLAVPVVQLSEPGEVEKVKLTPTVCVTIWDVWEVKCNESTTFRQLLAELESRYQLRPRDVFQESTPVYLSANMDIAGKEKQKEELMETKLTQLLDKQDDTIDLIVTFSLLEDSKILKGVPPVRLLF